LAALSRIDAPLGLRHRHRGLNSMAVYPDPLLQGAAFGRAGKEPL